MYNVTRKWADIQADFPANGVALNDIVNFIVSAPVGVTVTIQITLDSKSEIDAGTATWVDYTTVAPDTDHYEVMEYCPNGIKFVADGANAKAWIKS